MHDRNNEPFAQARVSHIKMDAVGALLGILTFALVGRAMIFISFIV